MRAFISICTGLEVPILVRVYLGIIKERVSHEKQQRKKQMNDIVCSCSVCDEPIYESQLDGETVDENRVYKCGELQYIELFHATCAEEYNRYIRRGI
jgi:hypothetical protein